jgi:hypothetical protein
VDWRKEFATELSAEELELFDKIAKEIAIRQMTVPALLLVEGFKPLNWIGSQFMLLLEPISVYLFNFRQALIFRRALQKREALEELAKRIEAADEKFGPKRKKKSSEKPEKADNPEES